MQHSFKEFLIHDRTASQIIINKARIQLALKI